MFKSFLILVTICLNGDNSCYLKVIFSIFINFTLFHNYHYLHLVIYKNTTTTSTSKDFVTKGFITQRGSLDILKMLAVSLFDYVANELGNGLTNRQNTFLNGDI
jgi:hypothetical protein